uniref:Estradiol 17-beta-dehydrogenase 12 n=1 Tax=Lygus hesperus TaxID=30085 RepID=A0A0A9YVK9_LYGHE
MWEWSTTTHYRWPKRTANLSLRILNVNLTSTMLMTDIVLKEMVRRDRGLIVNMCSASARIPLPYFTMYSSTKAFIENYSACLAAELSSVNSKVRVKCLEPMFVKTQLLKGLSTLINFLEGLPVVGPSVVDAPSFAASATATFGVETPVIYQGYWTQQLLSLLFPHYLGAALIADAVVWVIKSLKMIE